MINHGITKSTVKPEPILIDNYNVWLHKNIHPIEESIGDGDELFSGWEYEMYQYSKDEYILKLDNQIEKTWLALCEVYEQTV